MTTETKPRFFARLKNGLQRTRAQLAEGVARLTQGKKEIDAELLEDLEATLLQADLGVEVTDSIIEQLTAQVSRHELDDATALLAALKAQLTQILQPCEQVLTIDKNFTPYVILVVGINGAGKTTTIGKLAKQLQQQGHKVMLAAGDTFRAAAINQLEVWGERNNIPVMAQQPGADSAAVIFDALQAAKARGVDVLIADTAGRLHTQQNLMEELKKVKRVLGKLDVDAPHEVMLVLDAGIGQNAISQVQQFHEALALTGLTVTKLDGTAKGGVLCAIAKQFGLPIRFVGVGEGIDDLQPFHASEFVAALLESNQHD